MGLFNFNRVYIPDFSDLAKPLTEALKGGLPGASPLEWTVEMTESFTLLKSALASSPALHHPDMTKSFHIWTHVGPCAYNCVLGQHKGNKNYGIIGYYSTLIPSSMNGQLPCLLALHCAEWALKVTEPIVGYNHMVLHTPHRFVRLLAETKIKSISNQRRAKWETALMSPQLTVMADNKTNPASLMENEGNTHDCTDIIICDKGHFVRD